MIYVVIAFIAFFGIGTIWVLLQDPQTLRDAGVDLEYPKRQRR